MAIKNKALTVHYLAWDVGNNVGKTGDGGNHTLYVSEDGSRAGVDTPNIQELGNGIYSCDLLAAEMNAGFVTVDGTSSTEDIIIVPVHIATERGLMPINTTWTDARAAYLNAAIASRSSHSAAAVVTAMQAVASQFKADVSGLATAAALTIVDSIVDAIKLKTDLIGAAMVRITSPVATDGTVEIVRGDDYVAADGRTLVFTFSNYTGPSLESAAYTFRVMTKAQYDATGTVAEMEIAATGSQDGQTVTVNVPLTAAQSGALAGSAHDAALNYIYQIVAVTNALRIVTLGLGALSVAKDLEAVS